MASWLKRCARLGGRLVLASAISLGATAAADAGSVDVALVLAANSSASIASADAHLQKGGHAAALRAPEVMAAIRRGTVGCIAVTYFEFSSAGYPTPVLPWSRVCDAHDADMAAAHIEKFGSSGHSRSARGRTSLSYAIDYAAVLLDRFPGGAEKRVIDIAMNGVNNDGIPVETARNRAVAKGYTINALMLRPDQNSGRKDFETYTRTSVIGGSAAFAMPVDTIAAFRDTLRRKLVLEISSLDLLTPQEVARKPR